MTKRRRCATSDFLESNREKKQLQNKESSTTLDSIENTSVNGKLEEESKNLLQTEDKKALKNVELKKLSSTNEVCHHVSDKSSPATSRCFESLFFTDLHSQGLKQKRMSVPHGVTKQLRGVELSSNLTIQSDDDSNTQVTDL